MKLAKTYNDTVPAQPVSNAYPNAPTQWSGGYAAQPQAWPQAQADPAQPQQWNPAYASSSHVRLCMVHMVAMLLHKHNHPCHKLLLTAHILLRFTQQSLNRTLLRIDKVITVVSTITNQLKKSIVD
ncbi:unnamed protein product [Eruca vesicaria subsp. sativa]|uniref:Uncharacterized protein n=1 Tax=Eruca vesicaria subsp. sativa TaxID=29727 RepID=A0ABC8M430_ERUVS|nr:unnamed protein product [Eruca vesicaria subsp. sativa]